MTSHGSHSSLPLQKITIFEPPPEESTVLVGESVQLSVTASDPDGQSYHWDASACPEAALMGAGTATPTLSIAVGARPGSCQVSIAVCDTFDVCAETAVVVRLLSCGYLHITSLLDNFS